jgi:hypothetical protein
VRIPCRITLSGRHRHCGDFFVESTNDFRHLFTDPCAPWYAVFIMNQSEQLPKSPAPEAELPENVREQIQEVLLPRIAELLRNETEQAWQAEATDFITIHNLLQTLPTETNEQAILTHFTPILKDTSGDDEEKLNALTYYLSRYIEYAQLAVEYSPELTGLFPTELQDRAQFLNDHLQESLL